MCGEAEDVDGSTGDSARGDVSGEYRLSIVDDWERRKKKATTDSLNRTQFKAINISSSYRDTNLGARKFAWIARRPEVRVHSAVH